MTGTLHGDHRRGRAARRRPARSSRRSPSTATAAARGGQRRRSRRRPAPSCRRVGTAEPGIANRVRRPVGRAARSSSAIARPARESAARQPVPADYSRDFLLDLYRRMVLIREFEEGVKFLFLEGAMPGTIHQCQGQEATAVGVCAALEPGRLHHLDLSGPWPRPGQGAHARGAALRALRRHHRAAAGAKGARCTSATWTKGWCRASRSWAAEFRSPRAWRWRSRCRRAQGIVACFFGDGAVAEGAFHEGVNLAAIWDLPVIFVCENNLYGASTRVDLVMRNPRIADRAAAYGIRGETVDGNDVLAVYEAARSAAADCRRGHGPVLLELLDLSPHRPLPPRRLPLSAQGRTRGMVCPRPDRTAGPAIDYKRAGRSVRSRQDSRPKPSEISRPPSSWREDSRCRHSTI